jgi:phosphate uptake regulator
VPFERAADRCDFAYFDGAALCATSTAGRRQVNDARNIVGAIANDKAKTQTYCQILDLARQLERDRKKAKTLSEKIDQLQKQLGPEFVALMNGLADIDPRSPDGREVALIIESLDQSCPD